MMQYEVLKNTIGGIVFVLAAYWFAKRIKTGRKKSRVVLIWLVCMAVGSAAFLLPVENLFFQFRTPEEVFRRYQNNGEVYDVIEGHDSALVVYSQNRTGGYMIVPKSARGYVKPSVFSVRKTAYKFDQDGHFEVYTVVGTNDYYLIGTTVTEAEKTDVIDSNNLAVRTLIIQIGDTNAKTIMLYSFAENFPQGYYILVNGARITVSGG